MEARTITLALHELGFYEAGRLDGRGGALREAAAQLRATARAWGEEDEAYRPAAQLVEQLAVQLDAAGAEAARAGMAQLDRARLARPVARVSLRGRLRGAIIGGIDRLWSQRKDDADAPTRSLDSR